MSDQKKALNKILTRDDGIELKINGAKYAIFSDLHLGDKSNADNFKKNEQAFLRALDFYKNESFKLILLGDVEELWQFDLSDIVDSYERTVYKKIREFGEGSVFRVFGNHDIDFGSPIDPAYSSQPNGNGAVEFIKMKDNNDQTKILLLHGHQGTTDSDKKSWISRFLVRGVWTPIERHVPIINDIFVSEAATNSPILKDYEKTLYDWAKSKKIVLICGHSHRAVFASAVYANTIQSEIEELQREIQLCDRAHSSKLNKLINKIEKKRRELREELLKGRDTGVLDSNNRLKPCYFNTGCGVYTNGFTNIEIADGEIRLRKWNRKITAQMVPQDYGRDNLDKILTAATN